jgi:hypothetical protein
MEFSGFVDFRKESNKKYCFNTVCLFYSSYIQYGNQYFVLNHIIISGNCVNKDLKPNIVHLRKNDVIEVCLFVCLKFGVLTPGCRL